MTMLTVAEARARARKRLTSSMATWAALAEAEVSVDITLHPPTEQQVLADQAAAMDWATSWRAVDAPEADAPRHVRALDAPTVGWGERSWARVGRQQIPLRLHLRTPDAVADFAGGDEARQWRRLRERAATIRARFGAVPSTASAEDGPTASADSDPTASADSGPTVSADGDPTASAIKAHAKRIIGLSDEEFATVLEVVTWLRDNPLGSLRPRQLPIRGVDSKWFETRRSLVTALLAAAGHAEAVDVLDAEPRIRLRLLDPSLRPAGLSDISAQVVELNTMKIAARIVFVFENLESVLAMPDWPGAVATHGSGYAVDTVARLGWVRGARILYWGDLDSHGFAILSRLRRHLPQVESVLMDEATLLEHRDLWVAEPKPHTGTFSALTGTEERALTRIRAEGDVRLEQERIPWSAALERLAASAGDDDGPSTSAGLDRPATSAGNFGS
ncbi:MAG: Wadjet anti-phage system protein JetD domain-containing protein [Brevibacterium sp.]